MDSVQRVPEVGEARYGRLSVRAGAGDLGETLTPPDSRELIRSERPVDRRTVFGEHSLPRYVYLEGDVSGVIHGLREMADKRGLHGPSATRSRPSAAIQRTTVALDSRV